MWTSRVVLALALLTASVVPQERSFIERYQDMLSAFRAGDYAGMAEAAEEALQLRPRFPAMMVNLAIARALSGDAEGALDLLAEVADLGLAYDIAGSEELSSLAALPRFAAISARMRDNEQPMGEATVAFTLPQRDFFPEGIAVHPDGSFLVGSVRTGVILRVDGSGAVSPFADLEWSVFGMRVDVERGLLWAAISGIAQSADLAQERRGRAGVAALRLADGSLQAEYLLPDPDVERVVGDLVLDDSGNVFASDSIAGGIWVLRRDADTFAPVLPDGALASPQGLVVSAEGALYVAAYNGGVYRVDTRAGEALRLPVPDNASAYGIDGLYAFDGGLIAVQNGISPHRVARLQLDAEGTTVTRVELLLRADARFGEPTLGVVDGDALYLVANSPWAQYADPSRPPGPESLSPPTVLRLPLRRQPSR